MSFSQGLSDERGGEWCARVFQIKTLHGKVLLFLALFIWVLWIKGGLQDPKSRVIRICRNFLSFALTCVECEQSTLMPLLPLNHLYTFTTCVCAGCSVAVCPFCLLCQIVLFPLSLEGKPFRWACSPPVVRIVSNPALVENIAILLVHQSLD